MTSNANAPESRLHEASVSHGADPLGPVLLIGAHGMLGRSWTDLLQWQGLPHERMGRAQLDVADARQIEHVVTDRYRIIVNCAAWTDVDGAESHAEEANRINGDAVAHLADRCEKTGATLLHYSTDYVFNGQATRPYRADDVRDPVNAYGHSKALGEEALAASAASWLLIRTSWLYAPWGHNFVRTMAKAVREKSMVRVVDDQCGRPTSCQHLATASLELAHRRVRGIYHVTDGGECTWHGFAHRIGRQINSVCRVDACTSAAFPRPAARPAYSVLDLQATERVLGRMPLWETNLDRVLEELEPVT